MTSARIYTKLGDDGSTGLLFGGRTSKDDPLVDTIGTVDEAVFALGAARAGCTDPTLAAQILRLQRELFVVPGANATSAALDLARTIVRRAERRLVGHRAALAGSHLVNPSVLSYLNRASDLLYVLARRAAGEDTEPLSHDDAP